MPKHGDKLDENLYFCMYPITLATYPELEKLVKAATFDFNNEADLANVLGCSIEHLNALIDSNPQTTSEKYSTGGMRALLHIFEQFKRNVEGYYTDEHSCYLACFSCKKPQNTFSFKRDAADIEMMVGVLSAPDLDYTVHLGIQRSLCYALKGNPYHPHLAMRLHGSAAQFISEADPSKQFMVTNPLRHMRIIFERSLGKEALCLVSKYQLAPLRAQLQIAPCPTATYLQTFHLEELEEDDEHVAIKLSVLSQQATPALIEEPALEQQRGLFLHVLMGSPRLLVGGVGLLLSLGCMIQRGSVSLQEDGKVLINLIRRGGAFFLPAANQDAPDQSVLSSQL
ncbi:MAG: hypothetical protein NTW08_05470 [Gammaproteobacteria bacterium]|nr:hypothetical protein [Gammaproteobacteria bacterium]